ncbi:MAG: hypothetical protein MJ179_02470 [Treponema sp.]|nr:hypothetical protein [Treponema sp.]
MSRVQIDITGNKYGKLTVIKYVDNKKWLCRCDCGNEKIADSCNLKRGNIRSCGCIRKGKRNKSNILKYFFAIYEENEVYQDDESLAGVCEDYEELHNFFPDYTFATLSSLIAKNRPLYFGKKRYRIYKINKGEE